MKRHRSDPKSAGRRPSRGADGAPSLGRDKARWVIGIHSCMETLKVRPKAVREILLREKWQDSQQLRDISDLAAEKRITVKTQSPTLLDRLGSGHQGVALAATESPTVDWTALEGRAQASVILLDGIEDPHNLGAILRTAWLTGAAALVIPADRAVGLTPTVCKVASGGAEHVPVEVVSSLPSQIEDLKKLGFWVFGLAEAGTRMPWEFKLQGKVAWVVGSEGSGLRVPTERACDELVRLPQIASGSSYNASVAAAMAMMETCRQFGGPG